MDTTGIIALVACAASICAKMLFAFRIRSLERIHEQENHSYQSAQNELHRARQNRKRQVVEQKQLEARRKTIQRNIDKITKSLQELKTLKKEDDEIRAYQKEILQSRKKS